MYVFWHWEAPALRFFKGLIDWKKKRAVEKAGGEYEADYSQTDGRYHYCAAYDLPDGLVLISWESPTLSMPEFRSCKQNYEWHFDESQKALLRFKLQDALERKDRQIMYTGKNSQLRLFAHHNQPKEA